MYKTKNRKNTSNSVINGHIIVNFRTGVAHDKTIPHTEQNFEIYTDCIDNDVIMLKFERFRRKSTQL